MLKEVAFARVINRHHTHGYINTQYHVSLEYTDGSKDLLWMSSSDYMDFLEDPLILNGSVMFNASTYTMFLI